MWSDGSAGIDRRCAGLFVKPLRRSVRAASSPTAAKHVDQAGLFSVVLVSQQRSKPVGRAVRVEDHVVFVFYCSIISLGVIWWAKDAI